MQTILATNGPGALSEAARLHFTHVITPAHIFAPAVDARILRLAALAGVSVYFATGAMVNLVAVRRYSNALETWLPTVKASPNFAGVFVGADLNDEGTTTATYLTYLALLRAANVTSVASFGWSVLATTQLAQAWLGKADYEGVSVYTKWSGDGDTASELALSTFTDKFDEFAGYVSAASPRVTLGVHAWLQGFYDRWWGETAYNGYPSAADYKAVTDYATAATAMPFHGAACFGYASRPADRERLLGLAQWGRGRSDEIGYANGKLLSRLYVKPSMALVRYGESLALDSSVTATFSLVSGPAFCQVNGNVFTAGNASGTAVVRASVADTDQKFDVAINVYNEP